MQLGIIGASGNLGQRLVREARARGHAVVPFSRTARVTADGLTWRTLDVLDLPAVTTSIADLDVLVSCFQPGNAAVDLADTLRRSIADPSIYTRVAQVLIAAAASKPALRLIIIGGAGSLELAPGRTMLDDDDALRARLPTLGLPADYAVAVRGAADALKLYRQCNRAWTYLSPAADVHVGERTSRFRIGGDQLLVDDAGRSRISYEDLAVAVLDEIEWPRHIQRRFTVAY